MEDASHAPGWAVKTVPQFILSLERCIQAKALARGGYGWEDIKLKTGLSERVCRSYALGARPVRQ